MTGVQTCALPISLPVSSVFFSAVACRELIRRSGKVADGCDFFPAPALFFTADADNVVFPLRRIRAGRFTGALRYRHAAIRAVPPGFGAENGDALVCHDDLIIAFERAFFPTSAKMEP